MHKKQLRYFTYDFKNANFLGKMYLLQKIHKKQQLDVPGGPVISNCGTATEKVLCKKFNRILKTLDTFSEKLRSLGVVSDNYAILVTYS